MTASPSLVVYTAILGGYEPLKAQPARTGSAARFLCYTDDPNLAAEGWEIRPVTPLLPQDPVRSQRWLKLSPESLPEVAAARVSLYIDNTVRLEAPPEALAAIMPEEAALALAPHGFRRTVAEEFQAVLAAGLDEPVRVMEQYLHLLAEAPALLEERPWWGGLILRRHVVPGLDAAMAAWRSLVLRYSRRDQLSANLAFHRTGLAVAALPLDLFASPYHSWPHAEGRVARQQAFGALGTLPPHLAAQWDGVLASALLPAELPGLRQRVAALEAELHGMRQSRSWRLTAPLRGAMRMLRGEKPSFH
ncbi:hypothetical protein JYK14_10415 [Siccirubricoccus sp. KC 17139]|uniref:DUF616 domain-containing protein n=1 Tax=Siccirubricoccus soli TaxID=2899147 RepID=A0ABT1D3R2_9PROT|nr:hypothetical protein [Siccirubricoccus soli]MCO6416572.1 hypothetical protein [Siccirubricoccus soli]MCP2682707.1 hypothetical protein [Siccirubricoccus soli]